MINHRFSCILPNQTTIQHTLNMPLVKAAWNSNDMATILNSNNSTSRIWQKVVDSQRIIQKKTCSKVNQPNKSSKNPQELYKTYQNITKHHAQIPPKNAFVDNFLGVTGRQHARGLHHLLARHGVSEGVRDSHLVPATLVNLGSVRSPWRCHWNIPSENLMRLLGVFFSETILNLGPQTNHQQAEVRSEKPCLSMIKSIKHTALTQWPKSVAPTGPFLCTLQTLYS